MDLRAGRYGRGRVHPCVHVIGTCAGAGSRLGSEPPGHAAPGRRMARRCDPATAPGAPSGRHNHHEVSRPRHVARCRIRTTVWLSRGADAATNPAIARLCLRPGGRALRHPHAGLAAVVPDQARPAPDRLRGRRDAADPAPARSCAAGGGTAPRAPGVLADAGAPGQGPGCASGRDAVAPSAQRRACAAGHDAVARAGTVARSGTAARWASARRRADRAPARGCGRPPVAARDRPVAALVADSLLGRRRATRATRTVRSDAPEAREGAPRTKRSSVSCGPASLDVALTASRAGSGRS